MIEDLEKSVAEFINELLIEVQTLKKENKWREKIITINEYKFDNFSYNTQTGNMNIGKYSWQPKQIKILDQTLHDEIIQKIKEKNVYIELRNKIAALQDKPLNQVDFWIEKLIERILSESAGKELDFISVYPLLQTFVNDLIDGPIEWAITAYISGIIMNVDKIQLEKGISLRQPTVEDAQRLLSNTFFNSVIMPYFYNISAVLEIETLQKVQPTNFPVINMYVLILLLYKKGSINVIRTYWRSNSLIGTSGEISGGPIQIPFPNEKYVFNEEDKNKIIRFASSLKSKLPIDEKNGTLSTNNYIGIALARYQDSILKNEDVVNRISYAVMGLEALFLKSNEEGELSMRLSQRVSKLMQAVTGDNIFEIFETVNKAYKIRSYFVHGSFQNEIKDDPKAIFGNVVNYLRISIVVFLSIENKDKDKIINLLDHSILDHKIENKLQEMLSNYSELVR